MLGFIALFPYFSGEWEIAPNFAQKCDNALIRRLVVTKWCNIWKQENILFWWNYASLLLPISEEAWQTRSSFSSERRCRLYYRSPDGAAAERT